MKRLSLCLALMALTASAWAQSNSSVYTWRDAKGVTHYGDQASAPRNGAKERKLEVKEPTATQPTVEASAKAEDKPEQKTAYQRSCDAAQKNLELLSDPKRKVARRTGDDPTADPVELDEKARATELSRAQSEVKAYCDVLNDA